MSKEIIVSCLQYKSLESEQKTLEKIIPLIEKAASLNSDIVALPECATFLCKEKKQTIRNSDFEKNSLSISKMSKLAKVYKMNILIGSLQTKIPNNENYLIVNRSFLIDSNGKIVQRYDKIHMFDVQLATGNEFKESNTYTAGNKAKIAELNIRKKRYKLGLTICYDLRFPSLFQDLAKAGAEIIFVPSAFTKTTGQYHWHTLLKARAIETGCFVLAPAQVGKHFVNRESYGHSLIISPWGKILADGQTKEGIVSAKIDINEVKKTRKMIPNLSNQKNYCIDF